MISDGDLIMHLGQFGQQEIPHQKYLNDYLTGK